MKGELALGAGLGLVVLAALGVAGFFFYRNRARFDPTNEKNLANQGAGAVVAALTGGAAAGGEDTVGGLAARVREWWSGDDEKIAAMLKVEPKSSTQPTRGELGLAPDVGAYPSEFFMGAP